MEVEETATSIIRKALSENENLVSLLKGCLIGDTTSQHNLSPALEIFETIEVKLVKGKESVDHTVLFRPRKLLWNVLF